MGGEPGPSARGGVPAAVARARAPGDSPAALQPADRGGVCRLDPAVRAIPRDAASRRTGGAGLGAVSEQSRGGARGEPVDAEPCLGVAPLSLPSPATPTPRRV